MESQKENQDKILLDRVKNILKSVHPDMVEDKYKILASGLSKAVNELMNSQVRVFFRIEKRRKNLI